MAENLKETSEPGGAIGQWRRLTRFLSDVRSELTRVTWPSRREVWATTIVVILTSLVFGVYLWAIDLVLSYVMVKLEG